MHQKAQVASMLQSLLKITELPKHLDATDGLATRMSLFSKVIKKYGEKLFFLVFFFKRKSR